MRYTDGNLKPLPGVAPDVYPEALLTGVTSPEYDAAGSAPMTVQLTYQPDREA